jgi:hypothetical protein
VNSTELVSLFRKEFGDTAEPYLVSNEQVYRYLNEAQENFCRWTEGIEDASTPDVCRIQVVAGTDWYPISRKILKVREAVNTATGRPVDVMSTEKASLKGVFFSGKPGPLRMFVTGLEKSKLRAWPLPNESAEIELRVFRLPLVAITDEGDQELEIDEQHHMSLLHWVKARAYGIEDAETFDRRKADEYEGRFRAYCQQAKTEQVRARHSAGAVVYGGI